MKIEELTESFDEAGIQKGPDEQLSPTAEAQDSRSPLTGSTDEPDDEPLTRYPIGKAIYQIVSDNDEQARRIVVNKIRMFTWRIPPFNDRSEQEAMAQEYLWDRVLKKTGDDPRPQVVLQYAMDGAFEALPYEIKMRFIDEARKASAQKRGGDGEHIPIFDELTFDGEPMGRPDEDSGSAEGDAQRQPPAGSRIEHQTREIWLRFTENIRRDQLLAAPRIKAELGRAGKLYRFYLEHPDADQWTDVEIAQDLGVNDRTIRNYRRALRRFNWLVRFVKKSF